MPPNNLPVPLTRFIGRKKEIDQVIRLIAQTRLLTLTGAGGAGKTRLALQVARDLLDTFPDGVWFVELASLSDPALVPQTVASTFDLRQTENPTDLLKNLLRERNLLLVLDNCEHLITACAQLAETLLAHCTDLKILATSREALNIAGESTFRLSSLNLPNLQALPSLEAFAQVEAIRLFTERAQAVQNDFQLTDANKLAIARICARLDGMPLAIELAAARLKTLSVQQVNERLDDRFRLLTAASRTAPTHQQTLRAAMDWSYALLSAQEQTVLDRLSVFAGGWMLESAEAICVDAFDILDVLSHLVDKSLVIAETRDGAMRYRMLETIRQYALEKLSEAGERERVQNRHLEYFMKLAEEAEPKLIGADQTTWFNRLDSELDNLRTALDWSSSEDRIEQGLRLGGALYRFWLTRGYWSEGHRRLDSLLRIRGAAKRTLGRGKALRVAGALASDTGSAEISRRLYEESISILRELGPEGRPALESALGTFAFSLIHRDIAAARVNAEETARLSRESGNIPDLAQALIVLGNVARWNCDFNTAFQYLEQASALYQEIGDKRGVSAVLSNLVWACVYQGDLNKAKELCEQAMAMARELANKYHLTGGLARLGIIAHMSGQNDQAELLLRQAISELTELGNRQYVGLARIFLGRSLASRQHYAQAQQELRDSLALGKEMGKYYVLYALDGFAFLFAMVNQAEQAAQLFGMTEALRAKLGSPLAPGFRKDYDAHLTFTRAQLDDLTFNVAWDAGRAMSLEQAIEFALTEIEIPASETHAPSLTPRQAAKEKFDGLTAREREVATLIAQGKSNHEIADALVLSERTIEGHVSNILNKLGFNARSQIAVWAVQKGLEKS